MDRILSVGPPGREKRQKRSLTVMTADVIVWQAGGQRPEKEIMGGPVSLVGKLLLTALLLPLSATSADLFPLQVGNQWIYSVTGAAGGGHVVAAVLESARIGGHEYFLVAGLREAAVWLRLSEDGTLYSYGNETGQTRVSQETIWLKLSAAEGETYETAIHPCNRTARLDSRVERVTTPAGTFSDVVTVSYPSPICADAGLVSDMFAPSVGLVRRTLTTFVGPQILNLIYARVGDVTVLSQPEVAFSLSLDRTVYSPRLYVPVLAARITLRVKQAQPLRLLFPDAQRFDLVLKDEQGEVVYRWSDGRLFALLFGEERFGPGERNWIVEVPLQAKDGNQFPPGKYTAECWLTTVGERRYAAMVGFEIAAWRQPVPGLSGDWIFETKTSDGLLRAKLALTEDGKKLASGHRERLRLTGEIDGDKIVSSFNNGTGRGSWNGSQQLHRSPRACPPSKLANIMSTALGA